MIPSDDARLVEACLKSDPAAFEAILDLYKGPVYGLLLRLVRGAEDAEDLAQETFLKALRNLSSYDPSRPLLTWLFRIAHNAAVDFLRAKKPESLSLEDEESPLQISDTRLSLDKAAESRFRAEFLERRLSELPPLYREVLLMRHQEDMDYRQIGEVLGLAEGTVKIRLFRAREKLKEALLARVPEEDL